MFRIGNKEKLKSVATIMIMLISAMISGIVLLGSVSADPGPGDFDFDTGAMFAVAMVGQDYNISWQKPQNNDSNDNIKYNVTIDGVAWATGLDFDTNYSVWTDTLVRGTHTINVTACNWTDDTKTYPDSDNFIVTLLGGVPGVNIWQSGNYAITGTNNVSSDNIFSVINTSTKDLVFDYTGNLKVNGARGWTGGTDYFLYYPVYTGSKYGTGSDATYNLTWAKYMGTEGGVIPPKITGGSDYIFGNGNERDVTYNRSGLWLIDNDDVHNASSFDQMNATIPAWFWVNATQDYSLELSDSEFAFNSSGNLEVTLSGGEKAMVAIYDSTVPTTENTYKLIQDPEWSGENKLTDTNKKVATTKNSSSFTHAGNYTAWAYWDYDGEDSESGTQMFYLEPDQYYRWYLNINGPIYGVHSSLTPVDLGMDTIKNEADYYDFGFCGPWDPPEYNSTTEEIVVTTREYHTEVQNETQYWGFEGTVNITLKEASDKLGPFTDSNTVVKIYDDDDVDVSDEFTGAPGCDGKIDLSNVNRGWILINMTNWGQNNGTTFADNGTWSAVIYTDINDDRAGSSTAEWTEEWNSTVEWSVKKAPKAQFKWIDDDGGIGDSRTDGIMPYIPTDTNVPLQIEFEVLGQDGGTYGDGFTVSEKGENITLTGNALFTGKLDKIPGVQCNAGTWRVPVIPTMSLGGGEIKITSKAFNSTAEGVISIGGSDYEENGSIVEVTPNEFMIDQEDQTLTITVKNSDTGTANPYAEVTLYYIDEDGDPIEADTVSTTSDSPYTLEFNITQQTDNQTAGFADIKAPRNLTIYVAGPGGANKRNGYALIKMNPVNDLEVELSHDTIIAGKQYDDFTINCTFAGNSTDTPSEDDEDDFYIEIYNETGADWTTTLLNDGITDVNDLSGAYSFDFNNVYATEPGTYTFYAYNNTHNSKGYNATLVVEQVTVECDPTPLIWGYDDNISVTFTVTYNGEPINGSFILDNITKVSHDDGDYNATWYDASFNETTENFDGADGIEIDSDDLENGVITIHDITANNLEADEFLQNITFWFNPDSDDGAGAYAKAVGKLPVSVPTITPNPKYVAVGETTTVDITVTGRDTPLNDIFVALNGRGVDQNGTSGSDGIVTFSVLPTSSGNISIDVGEEGRTVDTVLIATNWLLDVSVSPDTVDEGDDFTVTVTEERSGDVVEGATVTINGIGSADTDENGEATFTAPSVTSDRSFTIKASKEGYAPETDTVTIFVTNVPALVISADAKVQAGATFDVAVAKDTGDPVVGATVTLDGEEYKTKAGGVATLTAPDKEGTYTITATFSDFVSAETTIKVTPGTPGFELLTLIAAIGVAFILLRRRRNK